MWISPPKPKFLKMLIDVWTQLEAANDIRPLKMLVVQESWFLSVLCLKKIIPEHASTLQALKTIWICRFRPLLPAHEALNVTLLIMVLIYGINTHSKVARSLLKSVISDKVRKPAGYNRWKEGKFIRPNICSLLQIASSLLDESKTFECCREMTRNN